MLAVSACGPGESEPGPTLPDPYDDTFTYEAPFADFGLTPDPDRIDSITAALEDPDTDACPLGDDDTFQPVGAPELTASDELLVTTAKAGDLGPTPTVSCRNDPVEVSVQAVDPKMTALVAMAILDEDGSAFFSGPRPLADGDAFTYCSSEDTTDSQTCAAVWVRDGLAISVQVRDPYVSAGAVAEWLSYALLLWVGGDDAPVPTPAGQLPTFLTDGGADIATGGKYVDYQGATADATITVFTPVELTDADFAELGSICPQGLQELDRVRRLSDLQLEGGYAQAVEMVVTSPDPTRPFPIDDYIFTGQAPRLAYVTAAGETTWSSSCSFDRTDSSVRSIGVVVVMPPAENAGELLESCPTAVTLTDFLFQTSVIVEKPTTEYGAAGEGYSFPVPADAFGSSCP